MRIYARGGIPTYWILNLIENQVEVYTMPTGPVEPATYRQRQDFTPGAEIAVVIRGVEVGRVNAADLLP